MSETEYMLNILHEVKFELKRLMAIKFSIELAHQREYATRLKLQGLKVEVLNSIVNFADCVKYSHISTAQKLKAYNSLLIVVQQMALD